MKSVRFHPGSASVRHGVAAGRRGAAAGSAASGTPAVPPALLAALGPMGFSESDVARALKGGSDATADGVVEWLCTHPADMEEGDLRVAAGTSATSEAEDLALSVMVNDCNELSTCCLTRRAHTLPRVPRAHAAAATADRLAEVIRLLRTNGPPSVQLRRLLFTHNTVDRVLLLLRGAHVEPRDPARVTMFENPATRAQREAADLRAAEALARADEAARECWRTRARVAGT